MDNMDCNKRSICETSMLLVANIIRLSSGRFSGHSFTKDLTRVKEHKMEKTKGQHSYLMKPPKEDPTTYVSGALEDVDINAENYINHVRGKIRDSSNIEH
ncbi:hypothetical protein VNO80_23083 [Phaseolus coccineus]|uniref:Uncharacterized protein n=1 Tax=Phaseolus coccineus TaxID=3886 RepID=A0AAN9M5B1_PHACN